MMKRPSLRLHIGTEKTGTTSIQEFLRRNAGFYFEKRVVIPDWLSTGRNYNHTLLPAVFLKSDRVNVLTKIHGIVDPVVRLNKCAETVERLRESALEYCDHKFIISSEHFQSSLINDSELENLASMLHSVFQETKIILYLRRPIYTAISHRSTAVKCGSTCLKLPGPADPYIRNLCMHKETIERWGGVFGMHNLIVRIYDSQYFVRENLLADFCDACEIPYDDNLVLPGFLNSHLSDDGLLLLSYINRHIPRYDGDKLNSMRADLVEYFVKTYSEKTPHKPSCAEISAYDKYYAESDQWVKKHLFPGREFLWTREDAELKGLDENNDAFVEPPLACSQIASHYDTFARLFSDAWSEKQAKIYQLGGKIKHLQSQFIAHHGIAASVQELKPGLSSTRMELSLDQGEGSDLQFQHDSQVATLIRIVGNLEASDGERSLSRIRYILANETSKKGLVRRWFIDRLVDLDYRRSLIDLFESYSQPWEEVPCDAEQYRCLWSDLGDLPREYHPWAPSFERLNEVQKERVSAYIVRSKLNYLTGHLRSIRQAFEAFPLSSPWILPWPGHSFLTDEGWDLVREALLLPNLTYLAVPAVPLLDGQPLPDVAGLPVMGVVPHYLCLSRDSVAVTEPFPAHSLDLPDRLSARLGLLSSSQHHALICPWDNKDGVSLLPDRIRTARIGFAFKLTESNQSEQAINKCLHQLRLISRKADMQLIGDALQAHPLRCWVSLTGFHEPIPALASIATNAREMPLPSVANKPQVPWTSDTNNYVNSVPHWQQLSSLESGLPRNVLLATGDRPVGDVAQHYDRVRLQLMIDCVCTLALDALLNGTSASSRQAVQLVRTWFLDPATAMIPDGTYARSASLKTSCDAVGASLDFRDFFPLLDALTILKQLGCFLLSEQQQLEEWFSSFLAWLAEESVSSLGESSATPASTWYHLLMLSIASYLGRRNVAAQVIDNLPGLLAAQFRSDGSPRSTSLNSPLRHEHLFNLQAWSCLSVITHALGRDLFSLVDSHGAGLEAAFSYASCHLPDLPAGLHGLTAMEWLNAMQLMHPHAPGGTSIVPIPTFSPLAEASTGLPPFWQFCQVCRSSNGFTLSGLG